MNRKLKYHFTVFHLPKLCGILVQSTKQNPTQQVLDQVCLGEEKYCMVFMNLCAGSYMLQCIIQLYIQKPKLHIHVCTSTCINGVKYMKHE